MVAGNNGLPNLANPDGEAAFNEQIAALQTLERIGVRRPDFDNMRDFYASAQNPGLRPSRDCGVPVYER